MGLAFFLYAILALTFIFAKDAVVVVSPLLFTSVRMMISGCLLYLFNFAWYRKIQFPLYKDIMLFFVVSLLHIYIPFAGEFWALITLDALKVNFLYSLTPFFAAIIEGVLEKKFPTIKTISGIIIGFCALITLFIIKDKSSMELESSFFSLSLPEIVLLCSVISATIAWFFIKKLVERGYNVKDINAWSMCIGGVFIFLTALFFEKTRIENNYLFFKNLLLLIFFSNILFYNLYGKLLERYSITFLTTVGFLSPFFGIFFESLMTHSIPDPFYFVTLFFVLIGLFLLSKN